MEGWRDGETERERARRGRGRGMKECETARHAERQKSNVWYIWQETAGAYGL